jgi:LytS/YehU family sensor histidine kinase
MAARSNVGEIRVSATVSGTVLRMVVEDNGLGTDHATLDRVALDRATPERIAGVNRHDATPGSGLDNLRLRLESIYSDRASVAITRRDSGGTRAVVELEVSA